MIKEQRIKIKDKGIKNKGIKVFILCSLLFFFSVNAQEQEKGFIGKTIDLVINDWVSLGNSEINKFDFGRLQTLPSYNHLEGFRLRAGVASNTRLHPHLFVRGYVAYGFNDEKFKYRGEAAWVFNNPLYHENEFPRNVLRLIHENDVYSFGEMNQRAPNDRLLITYNRSQNAMTYRQFTELNYELETLSGFAFQMWMRRSEIIPAEGLYFQTIDLSRYLPVPGEDISKFFHNNLITSDVGITLHYAFGESYDQYKRKRKSTSFQSPVLFLTHFVGIDGLLGSEVGYHRTEFSAQKRFLLGTAGRLDVIGEAIKVWNEVPFPLLAYHNNNRVHLIESPRFFLTHATELMADEVYTARATFVGDDLLLAKVSILNKLKMRELLAMRTSYGRLSQKNENSMFIFPHNAHQYNNQPFVEGSIGITNILGLLRVEYVHRFTYRDLPEAVLGMVRIDVTL
ncbi:MAG: DUF5686 family protein [Dysgonamonadaceae bacterium]|jgi:hypothetical protein|nr:DUF5686 family protein [Dysgonamonadaceae bacterium]